jgi:DNA-cytosine methyltransferase
VIREGSLGFPFFKPFNLTTMKYGSVCSGIEAASVAWHPLGWEPQWFSEIESFPSEVLKQRFPDVPNLGDMTQLTSNPTFNEKPIDLLVGGTPCQSFSVAGLRGGLADPRGNLMLTFLSLADAKKPKWIVWENVPGVLSSNGGKDFGTFLGALGELGYGFAYRVLDAQHFGVAQRRRRVFVVGYLGDWRVAAAVLFESESLQRDSKPSRKKRQETPTDAQGCVGKSSFAGNVESQIAACLQTSCHEYSRADGFNTIVEPQYFENHAQDSRVTGPHDVRSTNVVAQPVHLIPCWWNGEQTAATLTKQNANGAQRMPDKDNFGAVIEQVAQPIAYSFDSLASNSMKSNNPNSGCREVETSKTIDTTNPDPSKNQGGIAVAQPIAFNERQQAQTATTNCANTLSATDYKGVQCIAQPFRKVRRAQSDTDFETWEQDEKANTLNCFDQGDVRSTNVVAQPIAVDWRTTQVDVEKTGTLKTDLAKMSGPCIAVDTPTIIDRAAFNQGQNAQYEPRIEEGETMSSLVAKGPHAVQHSMAIRRLTPKECERLQGFPDDWTKIPYRNKPADECPDGPRYKACGNSMAVPVMRWIGERIEKIEKMLS